MSQRVPRFVRSGLALVCNVSFNGSIRWKDYNLFDLIFHTTAEALCFVKNFAKLFTTMFHLVFSFVLIMTQCPASGCSALIGYGGRCTARIVSEETKKSSPISIATNVFFKTTREWLVFPFLTRSTETEERSSRKKLNGDRACPQTAQLEGAIRKIEESL